MAANPQQQQQQQQSTTLQQAAALADQSAARLSLWLTSLHQNVLRRKIDGFVNLVK